MGPQNLYSTTNRIWS